LNACARKPNEKHRDQSLLEKNRHDNAAKTAMANIALKKWRKKELHAGQPRTALRARNRAREALIVTRLKVDAEASFNLASQAKISAHDASNLRLARHDGAERVTLDKTRQTALRSETGRHPP